MGGTRPLLHTNRNFGWSCCCIVSDNMHSDVTNKGGELVIEFTNYKTLLFTGAAGTSRDSRSAAQTHQQTSSKATQTSPFCQLILTEVL